MRYAQRAMRKFIPVMKNDKLNLWRAVYAERCKYGFRREYGTVEVGDRLCLPVVFQIKRAFDLQIIFF